MSATARSERRRTTKKQQEDAIRAGLYEVPRAHVDGELYVVDRAVVAPFINAALEQMKRAKPKNPHNFNEHDIALPPRLWLAAALHTTERSLWRVQNGVGFMGLSYADAILTVLGLEHVVSGLPVYPHPKYSRRRWIQLARNAGIRRPAAEYDDLLSRHSATLSNGSSSVVAPE